MRRILKWTIPVDDNDHPIGRGPVVLVACQSSPVEVQVWTDETDAERLDKAGTACVYGTGHELPPFDEAIGSALTYANGVPLVWHVIRRRNP